MAAPAFVFCGFNDASDWSGDDPVLDTLAGSYSTLPGWLIDGGTSSYVDFDVSSASLSEGWALVHLETISVDLNAVALVLSGPTTDLFRLVGASTASTAAHLKAQYYNGSTWVDFGSTFSVYSSGGKRLDIHWNIADSGGEITIYYNGGASVASFTGDTLLTADTTVDTITFKPPDATSPLGFGPAVVDSVDTRGLEWDLAVPTSNGTYTEWSGAEPEVDQFCGQSSLASTKATADASGERLTLNFPAITSGLAGYAVEWVGLATQQQAQADPALYMKPHVRKSSTDYTPAAGGSVQPVAAYDDTAVFPLANDPSTGSAWADQAAVEACEFGLITSASA